MEVLSYYGSEFFCPISLFRVYGVSEYEVIDTIEDGPEDNDEPDVEENIIEEEKTKGNYQILFHMRDVL